jgi:hypothetical protein
MGLDNASDSIKRTDARLSGESACSPEWSSEASMRPGVSSGLPLRPASDSFAPAVFGSKGRSAA